MLKKAEAVAVNTVCQKKSIIIFVKLLKCERHFFNAYRTQYNMAAAAEEKEAAKFNVFFLPICRCSKDIIPVNFGGLTEPLRFYLTSADVYVTCLQAERIMEALELYREESRKLEEHKYACENAGKQVQTHFSCSSLHL